MGELASRIFWVGIGGALGSVLRYGLAGLSQRFFVSFPFGTLVVNVTGCLAIGFVSERFVAWNADPVLRAAVVVGVLGGFTTFSTFSLDTLDLASERQYGLAGLNVLASVATCLVAVWFGQRVAHWWAA